MATTEKARRGPVPRISRVEVVAAAAAIVERGGYDALTMRAVARRCGVAPMSLYTYVRTKEELLGALADHYLEGLEPPDVEALPWQEQLATMFGAVHEALLQHPALSTVITARSAGSIALYRGAEVVLHALRDAGLSDDAAQAAFEVLASYTLGFVQRTAKRGSERDFADGLRLIIDGIECRIGSRP